MAITSFRYTLAFALLIAALAAVFVGTAVPRTQPLMTPKSLIH